MGSITTRAKENLIVVTDLHTIDILSRKDDDLYALIKDMQNNGNIQTQKSAANKFTIGFSNDSTFEDEFYRTMNHYCTVQGSRFARNIKVVDLFPDQINNRETNKKEFDGVIFEGRIPIPALPFCEMVITTQPPAPKGVIKNPQTIGEHIRNKRIQTQLLQKDVAKLIGVSEDCITYWENGRSEPQIQFMPPIIEFLGYMPIEVDTSTLGGKIREYRLRNGLSYKKLGEMLGVDGSTVGAWENEKSRPHHKTLKEILSLSKHKEN